MSDNHIENPAAAIEEKPTLDEIINRPIPEGAKWYAIKVHSGYEQKIADDIRRTAKNYEAEDFFIDFLVPLSVKDESSLKNKKGIRMMYPGYIYALMIVNDRSLLSVSNTKKVRGFLGNKTDPKPISDKEYQDILGNIEANQKSAEKKKYVLSPGMRMQIKEGTFQHFEGRIDSVDYDNRKVSIIVSIFGRETSVDVSIDQLQPVNEKAAE